MAQALTLGASLLILGYLVVDEVLFRARPALRRRGFIRLPRYARLGWKAYIPIPIALFLAWRFWTMPPIVSVYVLIVGGLTTLYLAEKASLSERVLLDRQVTDLARAFQGIYQLKPSVFSALEDAARKVDDPLRFHVMRAVQTFFVTGQPKRAFQELHARVENPYLDQFLYILDRAETSRRDEILRTLGRLILRLERQEELRSETEVNLAVIGGQTLFIQILSLLLIGVIALTPLRDAYVNSIRGQLLFVTLATVGVVTSWVIDRKTAELKERVL
ncbi:MAG: hypothetical protein D6791_15245 [Chloroflexi bacterium]|nr:MAG: hypothetical protein D6791_15245 [Chloroflexota bacterium]